MHQPRRKPVRAPLTAREFQVLELLAAGLDNAEICARLGIAKRSLGEHVANLTRKLQARNKLHAVAIAYRKGLMKTDRRLPRLVGDAATGPLVDDAESDRPAALHEAEAYHG